MLQTMQDVTDAMMSRCGEQNNDFLKMTIHKSCAYITLCSKKDIDGFKLRTLS